MRHTLAGMGEAFEWQDPDEDDLKAVREIYAKAVERES